VAITDGRNGVVLHHQWFGRVLGRGRTWEIDEDSLVGLALSRRA
jgi:hypothetical protein